MVNVGALVPMQSNELQMWMTILNKSDVNSFNMKLTVQNAKKNTDKKKEYFFKFYSFFILKVELLQTKFTSVLNEN